MLISYAGLLIPAFRQTPELSRTWLQSIMFDPAGYWVQLGRLVDELTERLVAVGSAPDATIGNSLGRALVANYLFSVVQALGSPEQDTDEILADLRTRCALTINDTGGAR